MDTKKANGRETEIQQLQEENKFLTDSRNSEADGRDSKRTEYQSQRTGGEMDASVGRAAIYRTFGGTLRLFQEVVKEGIDYMDSHGQRLEARLIEHSQKKASYLEKAAALEAEISRLLEQVEQSPEQFDEEE